MDDGFRGFPKDFFVFFRELAQHNARAWFEANKPRYRETVQGPMFDFIAAMAPRLRAVSKEFIADPRPNGGSMFRIYRDARFTRDKRPYKEHAACQFRHRLGRDVHAPGFYVHLQPGEVFAGGGLWMPEAETLARVRAAIAAQPEAWKNTARNPTLVRITGGLEDAGALTRPPRGYDPAHPFIADLKRKSFVATKMSSERVAQSKAFIDDVAEAFRAISPLMRFLCAALDVPY